MLALLSACVLLVTLLSSVVQKCEGQHNVGSGFVAALSCSLTPAPVLFVCYSAAVRSVERNLCYILVKSARMTNYWAAKRTKNAASMQINKAVSGTGQIHVAQKDDTCVGGYVVRYHQATILGLLLDLHVFKAISVASCLFQHKHPCAQQVWC